MIGAVGLLRLDSDRWPRVGPESFWPATTNLVAASLVLALTRFGGLVVESPRVFVRMALLGVYGWLGLAFAFIGRHLLGTVRHVL